jgi:hypothetical protein
LERDAEVAGKILQAGGFRGGWRHGRSGRVSGGGWALRGFGHPCRQVGQILGGQHSRGLLERLPPRQAARDDADLVWLGATRGRQRVWWISLHFSRCGRRGLAAGFPAGLCRDSRGVSWADFSDGGLCWLGCSDWLDRLDWLDWLDWLEWRVDRRWLIGVGALSQCLY